MSQHRAGAGVEEMNVNGNNVNEMLELERDLQNETHISAIPLSLNRGMKEGDPTPKKVEPRVR
jgi:hypothetical protein